MTHKEKTEQSRKQLLQTGVRLFGSIGYEATSVNDIEKELQQTRGSLIYHFKTKLGLFEATVNHYYLNRVLPSSVPEEYRGNLKCFITKYVSMLKEEWIALINEGIHNVASTLINLETDALRAIPNFREKCTIQYSRQLDVLEQVIRNGISVGEINQDLIPYVMAETYIDIVRGQTYRANIEGLTCYTDGMMRQFNSLYRLISSNNS